MANNIYGVGLRNVGSYQVAGSPYLTASVFDETEMLFTFPFVTKRILVHNTGSFDVQIYFQASPENKLIFSFPNVTKRIVVHNTGSADLYLYFSGSSINKLILPSTKKLDMDVKCTSIFVSSSAATGMQMLAEVTNIPIGRMYSFDGLEGV